MNRSYNFRMPPNLAGGQYGMMATPITAPAPNYSARVDPLTRFVPASTMAPTSETFGSLEISDPYMRELMRQYYVPPRPVSPLSYQNDTLQNTMVIPMEQAAQPSPYMQDLMRNYAPSMPRVPSMPASFQPAPQTQGNAFFTL